MAKTVEVSLFPIGQIQVTTQEDADTCSNAVESASFFDSTAPSIRIWHQHDMAQFVGGGRHIGFPIFELDTFTALEKHHLSSVDELFVCSEWAKDIIKHNGINVPTRVVPLGVDRRIFRYKEMPASETTVFYNCGKWEVRKGHDILAGAFKEAFQDGENVELWMMCDNPFNSEAENQYWHNLYSDPRIKLLPRVKTTEEVYNIMTQVDCGVFPARAEGWNLELLEMLSCGKDVITTNYAAHTEFCTIENSSLISIKDRELAIDNKWFHGQGKWAKLDDAAIGQTIHHMKQFYTAKNASQTNLRNTAGERTAKIFNWANTAERILEYVS